MPAATARSFNPIPNNQSAMTSLTRACLGVGLRALSRQNGPIVDRMMAEDRDADLLTKTAAPPATISGNPTLQGIGLAFIDALVPLSASAALIARSLQLSFDSNAEVRVPGLTLPHAAFIGEGGAIPVQQGTTATDAVLDPYKLAVLVELTGEMMRASNAEAMVRSALLYNVGPSLDAAMFSSVAGVPGISPPGLLNNVTPITAATGGGLEAMGADIAALADALGHLAGNGKICLVAAVKQSVALAILPPGGPPFPVFASSTLAAGTCIAVATQALATIVATPQIEASPHVTLHEETSPLPIVDVGGVMAHPVRSFFQTDSVGLRFKLPCSWALRGAGVSYVTGTTW